MIKHCLGNSQINSIPAWSKEFSYIIFLYRTLAKVYALGQAYITSIHSQREIKEISTLKLALSLTRRMKVQRMNTDKFNADGNSENPMGTRLC